MKTVCSVLRRAWGNVHLETSVRACSSPLLPPPPSITLVESLSSSPLCSSLPQEALSLDLFSSTGGKELCGVSMGFRSEAPWERGRDTDI